MNIVKQIIGEQYKSLINKSAKRMWLVHRPKEGWLSTTRNALGMSAAQLARRLGVTRAYISRTEKAELSGSVTLKTMQKIAESMGCRFVYAIVPEKTIEDILVKRARNKAAHMVEITNKHMALEGQALSERHIALEVERLQKDMLYDMPSDFWNDET